MRSYVSLQGAISDGRPYCNTTAFRLRSVRVMDGNATYHSQIASEPRPPICSRRRAEPLHRQRSGIIRQKNAPMTPERWQHIKQLLQSALERQPEQRNAFLAEACRGDGELEGEVQRLLAHATTETMAQPDPQWLGAAVAADYAGGEAPARPLPAAIGR